MTSHPGPGTGHQEPPSTGQRTASEWREALITELRAVDAVRNDAVEAALRRVPRHLFLPGSTLDEAYDAETAVITIQDETGAALSSVSAPRIQALMLEQAQVRPGMRGLEIGSGGYQAALLAELVGAEGEVTSCDIDPDVVERAQRLLAQTGYSRVRVLRADAEDGVPEGAPYDRIIVTAGAWDLPPAWRDQLAESGRLVVPLRMRGCTRSLAFEKQGACLVSRSAEVCSFIPMQGSGSHLSQVLRIRGGEITLRADEDELAVDPRLLEGALEDGLAKVWTGVLIGGEETFDTLKLWLATGMTGSCLLTVDPDSDTGLISPPNPRHPLATVTEEDSLAYLTYRQLAQGQDETTGHSRYEFGCIGHGPQAERLAKAMADQVRAWDRDHRTGPGPRITAHPRHSPCSSLPRGAVIDKRHVRLTLTWT